MVKDANQPGFIRKADIYPHQIDVSMFKMVKSAWHQGSVDSCHDATAVASVVTVFSHDYIIVWKPKNTLVVMT